VTKLNNGWYLRLSTKQTNNHKKWII